MFAKGCPSRFREAVAGCAVALAWILLPAASARAQWMDSDTHSLWPADIELTTVTGTVSVDASHLHEIYYLDEDGDGEADLHLQFGPFWYVPDSGAVRPDSGATITVTGLLVGTEDLPSLIVFELDGASWREPVEYGMHGWNGADTWASTFDTLTVSGTVLVDTTYFYRHYYLDEDGDDIPDYRLVFGPQWYEPASGAARPEAGAEVTVFGAVHDAHGARRLMVYELDGIEWREFGRPATWAGHWMYTDHADSANAYCVNDSASWMTFPPDYAHGGMGGMHWPDSMFVEFWRIPPDSLPGMLPSGHFAGFFIDVHDPSGVSMMGQGFGRHGGMMSFSRALAVRLHYHDEDLPGGFEHGMRVMAWDEEMHDWTAVDGIVVDTVANTVRLSGTDLNAYYVMAASNVSTHTVDSPASVPSGLQLYQNFPNPFSVRTSIVYRTSETRAVTLTVFDVVGHKIATLIDEVQPAGRHEVSFGAGDMPGGLYFVRLESGGMTSTQRIVLIR